MYSPGASTAIVAALAMRANNDGSGSSISTPSDTAGWMLALKALKGLRRDTSAVSDMERVHCVRMNLEPLRHGLEDAVALLAEFVADEMLQQLSSSLSDVEQFLSTSISTLSRRPTNLTDLEQAQIDRDTVREAAPTKLNLLKMLDDGRKVVSQTLVAGASGGNRRKESLDRIKSRIRECKQEWRSLDQRVTAFDDLIGEQRSEIAQRLSEESTSFIQDCLSLKSKWDAIKPGADGIADPQLGGIETFWYGRAFESVVAQMDSWTTQVQAAREKSDSLARSCASFDIPFEGGNAIEGLAEDVRQYFKDWGVLQQWRDDLTQLVSVDWVSFRPKLFELNDLSDRWSNSIRAAPALDSSEAIRRVQLESSWLASAMPGLRLMKGEAFQT